MKKILVLIITLISQYSYGQKVIQSPPAVMVVQAGVDNDFSFSVPPRARQTFLHWYQVRGQDWSYTSDDLLDTFVIRKEGTVIHYRNLPPGRYIKKVVVRTGGRKIVTLETRVMAVGRRPDTPRDKFRYGRLSDSK